MSVKKQCCGSETKVSDPVPDLARRKFWIRSQSGFESGFESGFKSGIESVFKSRIQIPDSNPDPDQKLAKTFFFNYKF